MSATRVKPISGYWLTPLVSGAATVAVALSTRDFLCGAIGTAVFSLFIAALLNQMCQTERLYHWKHVRKAQILASVGLVLLLAAAMRPNPRRSFRTAIGIDPPIGARDLVVDASCRVAADRVVLMQFEADARAMQVIAAAPGIVAKMDPLTESKGQWAEFWQHTFAFEGGMGGSAWRNVTPMKKPMLYEREQVYPEARTHLLWDAETGRAYLLYGTF